MLKALEGRVEAQSFVLSFYFCLAGGNPREVGGEGLDRIFIDFPGVSSQGVASTDWSAQGHSSLQPIVLRQL